MRLRVVHCTEYVYGDDASICHSEARLEPRTLPHQVVLAHDIDVEPQAENLVRRHDYFGNAVVSFTVHAPHRRLLLRATSLVDVSSPPLPESTPPWEALRENFDDVDFAAWQFVFPSPYIETSAALAEFAAASFMPQRPVLDAAIDLRRRIHAQFRYDRSATDVHTSVGEAFTLRRGVCQDFAHVLVGGLRAMGVPARYVSGYVRTIPEPGRVKLAGSDESHAWAAVYCGPAGWVDLDPTNDCIPGTDHVTVGWGRDYSDVPPVKGVTLGGGRHTVNVAVDVEPA